jgi:Na+-transporting NADH:ubiquinone oxidoreductase subunit NqrA
MKTTKLVGVITATIFMGFLGKAQQVIIDNGTSGTVQTTPASISQLQVETKLITQNSFSVISGSQLTGSFATNARWNSMGNFNQKV